MDEIAVGTTRQTAMLQQAVRLLRLRHHESGGPFGSEAEATLDSVLSECPGASRELLLSLAAVAEMLILMREEDGKGSGGDIAVSLRNMIHKAGGDA
jgi:hypothetical protein